jgi:hypothetical protein
MCWQNRHLKNFERSLSLFPSPTFKNLITYLQKPNSQLRMVSTSNNFNFNVLTE